MDWKNISFWLHFSSVCRLSLTWTTPSQHLQVLLSHISSLLTWCRYFAWGQAVKSLHEKTEKDTEICIYVREFSVVPWMLWSQETHADDWKAYMCFKVVQWFLLTFSVIWWMHAQQSNQIGSENGSKHGGLSVVTHFTHFSNTPANRHRNSLPVNHAWSTNTLTHKYTHTILLIKLLVICSLIFLQNCQIVLFIPAPLSTHKPPESNTCSKPRRRTRLF